jgi:hypothetical protein
MEVFICKIKNHPSLLQIGVKLDTAADEGFTERFE